MRCTGSVQRAANALCLSRGTRFARCRIGLNLSMDAQNAGIRTNESRDITCCPFLQLTMELPPCLG